MNIVTNTLELFKGKKEKVSDVFEMEISVYLNSMALDDSWKHRKEYLNSIVYLLNSKYGFNLRVSTGNVHEEHDARMLEVLRKLKTYGNK